MKQFHSNIQLCTYNRENNFSFLNTYSNDYQTIGYIIIFGNIDLVFKKGKLFLFIFRNRKLY